MNVGTIFEDKDDGLLHFVVRLGDGFPHVRRFASLPELAKDLESVMSFDELMDFWFRGVKSKGKLTCLPGCTEGWAAYLRE